MSEKLKLEVLMSAMHQDNFDIAYKTKINSDLLIINQCDKDDYVEMTVDGHLWRMISTTERGLSKSRNMALENAKGDICLLCDDDEVMEKGYVEIISKAYEELPKASAIVFNLRRINYKMKKNYYSITKIRKAPIYRGYSSQMLTFRPEPIKKHGIRMNEKFGSGTQWGGGEEILFEDDIRKKGLLMYEYPALIATIDYANGSSWFTGYTEKYFYNLGAYVQYRFPNNPLLRQLRQLFTCYRLRRENDLSFFSKMHWMNLGGKGIKTDVTYQEFVERRK